MVAVFYAFGTSYAAAIMEVLSIGLLRTVVYCTFAQSTVLYVGGFVRWRGKARIHERIFTPTYYSVLELYCTMEYKALHTYVSELNGSYPSNIQSID